MAWICYSKHFNDGCEGCRYLGFDQERFDYKGDGEVCLAEDDVDDCPICGKPTRRSEFQFTYDCHGIPYRHVCLDCWDKLMAKGYDGEY